LQTTYFSENLVRPGIEPGTYGSVARNTGHLTTEAVKVLLLLIIMMMMLITTM
jgi:hypothetical protein